MVLFSSDIEFSLFIIAVIANVSLAISVLRFAPKNLSRFLFSGFVLTQLFWIIVNFYSFRVSAENHLFFARLTLFTSPFHAFAFYCFIKTFLVDKTNIKKRYFLPFLLAMVAVAGITLTPYVLQDEIVNAAGARNAVFAKTAGIYLLYIFICIGGGFVVLIKRFRKSVGEQHKQWLNLLTGLALTFFLVLVFSLFNPLIFGNIETVRFGHLFTLPFVVFTAYAMIKHHLLNLKAVLAEISVMLLNLFLLIRFITSEDANQFFVNGFVLVGSIIVGVYLVKGVYREIHQREQLQVLNDELDNANAKLQDLDKARAEFISIASHQLRTPPATIKWYLSAIKSGDYGSMDSGVRDTIVKAEITNNAQISLIDDLLNASRIERGKMEFLFEEGDLVALAQMAYDQLVPQASMKKLTLSFTKPTKQLPLVVMDKEKLRQVINNFIDNAIKYTRSGGVTVSIIDDANNMGVKVTDTGKGFSPEVGPVLFEKYTRGKDSVMHSQGLGLGLYVAKVIIEKHNGKIWAESPGEEKGSSFCFTVPIHNTITPSSTSTLDLTQSQGEHK